MPGSDLPELARRFGALYTAAVADVLDDLGHLEHALPAELVALAPGMRLAGPAFAVEGRPNPKVDYEDALRRLLGMLGVVPAGHVAVYQTNDRSSAQFGELSATALAARGCAGVVLEGGCRDVDFIVRAGFPVFARYTTPVDSMRRWEPLAWGHEVEIGGVAVATGNYVLGDADGLVVIPAALTVEVLERAEAVASTEDSVRAAVREGMTPLEAYDRFGKF